MKSPKTLLIALLTLTTLGGAALAWRQYMELVELRALAMNRDERADLQKRIWDLEKANRDLQERLTALGGTVAADIDLAQATDDRAERGRGWRGPDGRGRGGPPGFAAVRELMNKPEVQAMIATQQKAAIEARYAALFKNLNLTPEQSDRLSTLLAERMTSRQDVFEAAHAQGIDPRDDPEAFRKLLDDSRNQIDTPIKGVIGDSGLAQLQTYEQTMPQRNLVGELQQRLSSSNTPLTPTQADQLVQILAANAPPRPAAASGTADGTTNAPPGRGDFGGRGGDFGRGPDLGMMFGRGGPDGAMMGSMIDGARVIASAPITTAAVNQAQAVLSQPQVSALQQMQKQQQTQQQLAQMVHDTIAASQATSGNTAARPAPGSAPGTSGAPAPAPVRRRGGG